jgi:phenylalanyl-tRNA synthetase beta chain
LFSFEVEDAQYFIPSKRLVIKTGGQDLGVFGQLNEGYFYFEIDFTQLTKLAKSSGTYKAIPKYPAQVEDLTLKLVAKTKIGEVLTMIKNGPYSVDTVILKDLYEDKATFRLRFQDKDKTLTNEEVEKLRSKIVSAAHEKFGAIVG